MTSHWPRTVPSNDRQMATMNCELMSRNRRPFVSRFFQMSVCPYYMKSRQLIYKLQIQACFNKTVTSLNCSFPIANIPIKSSQVFIFISWKVLEFLKVSKVRKKFSKILLIFFQYIQTKNSRSYVGGCWDLILCKSRPYFPPMVNWKRRPGSVSTTVPWIESRQLRLTRCPFSPTNFTIQTFHVAI